MSVVSRTDKSTLDDSTIIQISIEWKILRELLSDMEVELKDDKWFDFFLTARRAAQNVSNYNEAIRHSTLAS